ncbi:MAG: phage baseplate assembly protein V [Gammaproteobacteria bacterium]
MREPTAGVVVAKVTDVNDSEGLGRIQVAFPWLSENNRSRWASVASVMAGPDRGVFFMPEVDDEVLIAFEHGDWDHPYVIGFLWNEVQRPPSGDIRQRMIQTVNGHKIRFLDSTADQGNMGGVVIEDAHGNKIVMTNAVMRIVCQGRLEIDATGSISIKGREVNPLGGMI